MTELKDKFDRFLTDTDEHQRFWLGGYLSGLLERGYVPANGNGDVVEEAYFPETVAETKILVAYASQTGNAQAVAKSLWQQLQPVSAKVDLKDCAKLQPSQLRNYSLLWFVVSTHGDGEPPESASIFFHRLGRNSSDLGGCSYGVIALGDSSYDEFCAAGKWFDERLEQLGGERVHQVISCDVDYQPQVDSWFQQAVSLSNEKSRLNIDASKQDIVAPLQTETKLLGKQLLNDRRSDKQTWHFEISSTATYLPGDALSVITRNPQDIITYVAENIKLLINDSDFRAIENKLASIDFSRVTRNQINAYIEVSNNKALQKYYQSIDQKKSQQWLRELTVPDLITKYPPTSGNSAAIFAWLDNLSVLQPRLYSIASSPLLFPDEIHIAVRIIERQEYSPYGIASNMLHDCPLEQDMQISISSQDHFRLPEHEDTDLIMISAGTGIAPYRSFMQHRQARQSQGKNWLFYGDRTMRYDFLYQQEVLQWREDGLLTRLDTAFSRDGQNKEYVQHRLQQQTNIVWQWIEQGAVVYVCGDANSMAPEVHNALKNIIAKGIKGKDADAEEYLNTMKEEKRYQRDVY